ncbi:MAG: 30S ribosomal protein S27ae [Methanobacteriota archaeon]
MTNRWEQYEISGDTLTRKRRSCPKCGDGVFLAQHKNRSSCGNCAYTEFAQGSAPKPKEASKPDEKKQDESKPAEKPKNEGKPEEKLKEEKPAEEKVEDKK